MSLSNLSNIVFYKGHGFAIFDANGPQSKSIIGMSDSVTENIAVNFLKKYILFIVSFFAFGNLFSEKDHFEQCIIDSGWITNRTEIKYSVDEHKIGSISYTKIPVFPFYIVHSFYIYPEYRNRGNGKKLLIYMCDLLQTIGAKRIYIQPGPFEIINGHVENITDASRAQKIHRLCTLYAELGFDFVDYFTCKCACVLYKMLGISEDSNYLMCKVN